MPGARTCPECGAPLIGADRWTDRDRPLRAQLTLHCPTHGKPAYNDPSSPAYQRRERSMSAYESVRAIDRFRLLLLVPLLTVLGLFSLGRLPIVVGAVLGPPLGASGALLLAWLQHRHVHRDVPRERKIPPYHPWLARRATSRPGQAAAAVLGAVALTSSVATRSLVGAVVTTIAYAAALALTWRPGGPLRRWALAHRDPSVLETR